jgi:hypothetical protein
MGIKLPVRNRTSGEKNDYVHISCLVWEKLNTCLYIHIVACVVLVACVPLLEVTLE